MRSFDARHIRADEDIDGLFRNRHTLYTLGVRDELKGRLLSRKVDCSAVSQYFGAGAWNWESSDYIEGCDGACMHVAGSLAGAGDWSITNVTAFLFFNTECEYPVQTALEVSG